MDYADRFERKFFTMVMEEVTRQNIPVAEFGKRMAGNSRSDKRRVVYAMKGTTASGNPQRIRMADAYRMCQVIGQEFPVYMMRVKAALEDELRDHRPEDSR